MLEIAIGELNSTESRYCAEKATSTRTEHKRDNKKKKLEVGNCIYIPKDLYQKMTAEEARKSGVYLSAELYMHLKATHPIASESESATLSSGTPKPNHFYYCMVVGHEQNNYTCPLSYANSCKQYTNIAAILKGSTATLPTGRC